ncbi:DNA sulfur modification protein DndD [Bacillus aerolatus]|uniref:Nuclease SbcCD subunit C n=1 Tax=Bacillus aerolatus TaxID=2653354 RepID=A0A6I1FG20_9BACI|nr:DNA sulfur modification protein DndD [Bacillus aerolatus]KAB7707115.1 DNA sulfur modification protein DndD [Bacillus aerolatus]
MLFKKLIFNNYKTYYGIQEINLSLSEDDLSESRNIILFGGLNGAGKTTILKAIKYVLFGERGISDEEKKRVFSNTINDTYFDEGGRESSVSLIIELDNGEEYIIKVEWLFDHLKRRVHENRTIQKVGVFRNKNLNVTDINAFNRFIDRVIPYNAAPFFIFDGEEIRELITKQDASSMRLAIHKITGLDTYKHLLKDLDSLESSLYKKMRSSTNAATVESYKKELIDKEEQLQKLEERIIGFRKKTEKIKAELNEVTAERNKKLTSNSASRELLVKKQAQISTQLELKRESFKKHYKNNIVLILLADLIKEMKASVKKENEQKVAKIMKESSLAPYHEFIEQLLQSPIDPPLSDEQLRQIKKIGEAIWLKKEKKTFNVQEVEEIHDLSTKDYQTLLSLNILDQHTLVKYIEEIELLHDQYEKLEAQILDAPTTVDVSKDNNTISVLNQRLGELQVRMRSANTKLSPLREAVTNLKNKLSRSADQGESTELIEQKLEYISRLKAFTTEYLERMTELKAQQIQDQFSFMLNKLIRKTNEFSRIVFDRTSYSIKLYNDRGQEISMYDRSAGEMQLISSSFIWALIKASDLELPMVIDTPLGRLDSIHRNHLVKHYYTELSKQVIILSTDTEITEEYVELMEKHSAKQYLLDYDEEKKYTIIRHGYFNLVEVK